MSVLIKYSLNNLLEQLNPPPTELNLKNDDGLDQLDCFQNNDAVSSVMMDGFNKVMSTQSELGNFLQEHAEDIKDIEWTPSELFLESEMSFHDIGSFLMDMGGLKEFENLMEAAENLSNKLVSKDESNLIEFGDLKQGDSGEGDEQFLFSTKEIYERCIVDAPKCMKHLEFTNGEIALVKDYGYKLCLQAIKRVYESFEELDQEKKDLHRWACGNAVDECDSLPFNVKELFDVYSDDATSYDYMVMDKLLHKPIPYDVVLTMIASRRSQLTAEFIYEMKESELIFEDEIEEDRQDMEEKFGPDWEQKFRAATANTPYQ